MKKIINYTLFETTPAIPEASSMIETFRAIGYNVETAIADIIDNSISANAKNIWIDFEWLGNESWISIKDDGIGMNNKELIQALKPGSKNPLSDRTTKDLGRFGLGLKTASFSQARKLTVISKKENEKAVYWTWDLDYVNQTSKWELINYLPNNFFLKEIEKLNSGTVVIWNDIDRIVKNFITENKDNLDKFTTILKNVKEHLKIVFHRFIKNKVINIFFKDDKIIEWNPFLENLSSTQAFPEEPIQNGKIILKGYVLPHKSNLTESEFKFAEGTKGWNEHQGFYIYRNDRLILAGDWLGLFRKEEHYKLARIQIDLPNTLDSEWQIDIKKSIARPPLILKDTIKQYALKVRNQAIEVYRHRGKNVKIYTGQQFIPLWIDNKRSNKWFYKINREHPLIEQIKIEAQTNPNKAIENLMRFIEETIPSKSIYIKEAENSEEQGKPFEASNQDIVQNLMQIMFTNLVKNGKSIEQAKSIIANTEPFNQFTHFLEFLK